MNETTNPGFIETLYEDIMTLHPRCFRTNSPHHKNVNIAAAVEKTLLETMSPEQKKLFEAYVLAEDEVYDDIRLDTFLVGFRLGGQCVYDIFLGTDAPLTDSSP